MKKKEREKDRGLHFLRKRSRDEIRLSPPLSLSLFGLAISELKRGESILISEEEPDCLAMWSVAKGFLVSDLVS